MDIFAWLNAQQWFGAGANVLQYVGSVGLLSYIWNRWEHQCRGSLLCLRTGQIEVKGTTWKVCPKHSTRERHDWLRKHHARKHVDRVGHL